MNILEATRKVKNALSSRDYIASLTHYHIRNKEIFASNGSLVASAPIDEDLEHVVPAEELDKALTIFGQDALFEWSKETLTIKKGRRKITIRLLEPEAVSLIDPVPPAIALPADFITQIKRIYPFISDDASRPWALTGWLHQVQDGHTVFTATNNISVVEVDATLQKDFVFPEGLDTQLPNFALQFLIDRVEGLTHMGVAENRVSFYFIDGSQVTTQLFVQKMPEQVSAIVQDCYEEVNCGFKLTEEWQDAYKTIVQLSPEEVMLTATSMTAGRRQAVIEVEAQSPVPHDTTKPASYWNPKFLTPVVDVATHIDFASYPKPSKFYGVGIRGLTIGKMV